MKYCKTKNWEKGFKMLLRLISQLKAFLLNFMKQKAVLNHLPEEVQEQGIKSLYNQWHCLRFLLCWSYSIYVVLIELSKETLPYSDLPFYILFVWYSLFMFCFDYK